MTTEGQDHGEDTKCPDGTYYDRIKGWMVFHCSNSIENRQTKLSCLDLVRPIPRLDAPGSKTPFADHEVGDARFGTVIMRIDLPLEDRESAFIVTATREGPRTVFVVARYRRHILALAYRTALADHPCMHYGVFLGG